jgi:hypothetical protein
MPVGVAAPRAVAAVDVESWAQDDREMLAEGIALVRGQLDLLERVPARSK